MEFGENCHGDSDDDHRSYVSDGEIDSDLEARLYSQIHHEQQIAEDVEVCVNQIRVTHYSAGDACPTLPDVNVVSAIDENKSVSITVRLENLLKKARTKLGFSSKESKKSKKNRMRKIKAENEALKKKTKMASRKQKVKGELDTDTKKQKESPNKSGEREKNELTGKKPLKKDKKKKSKKAGEQTEGSESVVRKLTEGGVLELAKAVKERNSVQMKNDNSFKMEASTSATGSRFAEDDSRVPPKKRRIRVFSSSSSQSDSVVEVVSSEEEEVNAVRKKRRLSESPAKRNPNKRIRMLNNFLVTDSVIDCLSSEEEEETKGARSIPKTIIPTSFHTSMVGVHGKLSDVMLLSSDEDVVGSSDESDVCVVGHLPLNRNDWKILDTDLKDVNDRRMRYYSNRSRSKQFECHNCRMPGHMARACPLPTKVSPCTMCGEERHQASRCPNYRCFVCGSKDHDTNICRVGVSCRLCHRLGHRETQCPDTWRVFHASTNKGQHKKLVQLKPRASRSCFNCAGQGHYGHECTERRMMEQIMPNSPAISETFAAANGLAYTQHGKNAAMESSYDRNWNNSSFRGGTSSNYGRRREGGPHQRFAGQYR